MSPSFNYFLYGLIIKQVSYVLPVVLLCIGELFVQLSYINTGVFFLTLSFFWAFVSIILLMGDLICLQINGPVMLAYLLGLYMRPFIRGPALITVVMMTHLIMGIFTMFK